MNIDKEEDIMIIEFIKTADLVPYANNSRTHTREQIEQVAASIREFGFTNPVLIDKDNGIIAGHARTLAAFKIGMGEVPCIRLSHLTEAQKKAYVIADNKLALNAGWDEDMLAKEIQDLVLEEFDLDLLGFNEEEMNHILNIDEKTIIVEDEPPWPKREAISKIGDIWVLGEHRLMCGDATNEGSIKKLVREDILKCIFTSPPYNMNAKMYEEYQDNLESKKYIEFNMKIIDEWVKHLKGYLYWNISYNKNSRWEFIEILHKLATKKDMKFLELIVWDKTKGMPIVSKKMLTRQYESIFLAGTEENVSNDMDMYYLGNTEDRAYFNKTTGKGITNYWRINPHGSQIDNHRACFPVRLPAKGIELVTREGDIVGDPFGGSGSTLIACEQLDRICYMMELDPIYIDVIVNRYVNFKQSDKGVVLIRDGKQYTYKEVFNGPVA